MLFSALAQASESRRRLCGTHVRPAAGSTHRPREPEVLRTDPRAWKMPPMKHTTVRLNIMATSRLVLVMAIGFAGLAAAEPAYDRGLLWRVEGLGPEPDYIYGTIHIEDSRVLPLAQPVSQAFGAADRLVMELEPNAAALAQVSAAMSYPDGRVLKQTVGPELHRRATAALAERGIPEAIASKMRPWAILLTLNMPEAKTGLAMDLVLYLQALQAGKTVRGLETAAEQVGVFADLPMAIQIELLRDTLDSLDRLEEIYTALVDAYVDQDLEGMRRLNEEAMAASDPDTRSLIQARLIGDRNRRMVERMLPWLEDGAAFVAVGALHLAGPDGILQRLTERGYRLTRVE